MADPKAEDDLERLMLSRSKRFQALREKSRRSIKAGKGLTEKEFWQTVDKRARAKQPRPKKAP